MRKNHKPHWYEMTSRPDPSGRVLRYYEIRCKSCGGVASYHASGLTDDQLKKFFIRKKWHVGKSPNQHLCPTCSTGEPRPKVERSPPPVPPPPPPWGWELNAAWERANGGQRLAFMHRAAELIMSWAERARTNFLTTLIAALSDQEQANLIAELQTYLPTADVREVSAPLPPPPNNDTDDGAADWWKDMMQQGARR